MVLRMNSQFISILKDDGSVELVRCADDPPGTIEGRLGLLKPQTREEIQSASNPIPSYGIPSAPAIQEPVQTYKNVDTFYGSPPPAPSQDYDYPLPSYSSPQPYQSSYRNSVPANLVAKRETNKGIDKHLK